MLSKKSKDNIEKNCRDRKEKYPLIRQKEVEKKLSFENGKEDIDYVVCKICLFKGHNLDRHIKTAHKISLEEYKKMFPKALIYYKRYQIQNILKRDKKFEILFLKIGVSYTQYKAGYNEKWTKELREEVRKRDNYTCQVCGDVKPKAGSVHHIDYDKKNSILNNLIYLCKGCHTSVESAFFAFGWTFYFQELLMTRFQNRREK
jgi:5-methylcytosine-specific restriction endonuclease McrA